MFSLSKIIKMVYIASDPDQVYFFEGQNRIRVILTLIRDPAVLYGSRNYYDVELEPNPLSIIRR